jgi:hypothetical protein
MKTPFQWLLLLPLVLAVVAQAREPAALQVGIAPPKRIPEPVTPRKLPEGTPIAAASVPKEVRRAVVADAARRFEVAESAVVLVRAEQVTWSDGSLGCPSPGSTYAQMLVPGYRITATTAAGQMLYHTDAHGNVVTCAVPARPARSSN